MFVKVENLREKRYLSLLQKNLRMSLKNKRHFTFVNQILKNKQKKPKFLFLKPNSFTKFKKTKYPLPLNQSLQFFHFFKKSKHNILRVTERFLPFPKKFSHLIILKHLLRSPIFFKPQRRGWGRAIKEKTFYTKEKPLSFIVTNKKKTN